MKTIGFSFLFLAQTVLAQPVPGRQSRRAWTLNTNQMQRVIVLEGGRLFTQSWTDRRSGQELLGGEKADEFAVVVDGKEITGLAGGWTLVSARSNPQKAGSVELALAVRQGGLDEPISPPPIPSKLPMEEASSRMMPMR